MGTRFRKSVSLGKGVRVNVGKGSVGVSVGTKGAHISANSKRGITSTVSAPGTGLSYSKTHGWGHGDKPDSSVSYDADDELDAVDADADTADADTGYTPNYTSYSAPNAPKKPRKKGGGKLLAAMVLVFACLVAYSGLYTLLFGARDSADQSAAASSAAVSGEQADASDATATDVSITPEPQAAPIDAIADGVVSYLEGQGYPVASTRKIADKSRVECVVTVPGVSDSDGSTTPPGWADLQSKLVTLAAGAQSAVTDQGDYTVLTYVQSVGGDNLLAADAEKVIYDKFKLAEEASKPQQTEEMVYVSATGSKYHSKPNCGNMKSSTQITLSEAVARGLTPCSRCH